MRAHPRPFGELDQEGLLVLSFNTLVDLDIYRNLSNWNILKSCWNRMAEPWCHRPPAFASLQLSASAFITLNC